MLYRASQAGLASQGVAEQVRLRQPEACDNAGDVVAETLEAEGPLDVAGVAMPLQFDGDHPAVTREGVEQFADMLASP